MDVTQLPVTQVTNPDTISPLGIESDENGQLVTNDDFKSVMEDVLAGDALNQETDQPAESQGAADSGPMPIPVALPVDLPVVTVSEPELEVLSETPVLPDETLLAEPIIALPANESPHLAWFAATGFEPPNASPTDDAMPVTVNLLDTDAVMASDKQTFMIPPSQPAAVQGGKTTIPATNVSSAEGDDVDALSLMSELTGNKKEMDASLTMDDKLLTMAESATRLEKRLNAEAAVNHLNGAMGAINQAKTQASPTPQVPMPAKSLDLPVLVDSPEWGSQFSQQITWLGQQKIDRAVIRLNPQELGPLEVNIKFHKDEASLTITAHTLHVRDMIEQAIPRLRDMMSEQGINLSQFSIESNASQHQAGRQPGHAQHPGNPVSPVVEEGSQETSVIKNSRGLIDYFA
ncbi:flagellar hook-length control protein FliK [Legionella taurinensis]|nr:flagellar hook-length control protein FliK [Legionella taurinensis]MDX1836916.1 flagellar hook-length control protein FliK [Legionella taurinensis]STY26063.1 flagellar hook-length control protein FliK [Legionella taurinensis]